MIEIKISVNLHIYLDYMGLIYFNVGMTGVGTRLIKLTRYKQALELMKFKKNNQIKYFSLFIRNI